MAGEQTNTTARRPVTPWSAWIIGFGGGISIGAPLYLLHSQFVFVGLGLAVVGLGVVIRAEEIRING